MFSLTVSQECPHQRTCDIDAARAGKISGTQRLTGRTYDDGAGSDIDWSKRTPHQANSGAILEGRSSNTRSRSSRSRSA